MSERNRQGFHAKIKSAADGDRIIEGYASVEREDRDGEIIPIDAFDFRDYNGTLLYNHGMDPEIAGNPVGEVMNWRREPSGLWVKARVTAETEHGEKVWRMIQDELINSFSVSAPDQQVEKDGNVITHWPVAEISVVSLPSNPSSTFAVSKNYKSVMQSEQSPNVLVKDLKAKMNLLEDELRDMLGKINEIKQ